MNRRLVIISVALALPIIAIVVMAQQGSPSVALKENAPAAEPQFKGPPASLAEARTRTKQRAEWLGSLTEEQWAVIQRNKNQHAAAPRRAGPKRWEELTPDQQIEQLRQRQNQNQNHGQKMLNLPSTNPAQPAP